MRSLTLEMTRSKSAPRILRYVSGPAASNEMLIHESGDRRSRSIRSRVRRVPFELIETSVSDSGSIDSRISQNASLINGSPVPNSCMRSATARNSNDFENLDVSRCDLLGIASWPCGHITHLRLQ